MGCTTSQQQNTAEDKQQNFPKTQSVGKSENGKALVRETVNGASKAVSKVNNSDAKATRREDNNINSPRESLETIVTKKEKPRGPVLSKRTSIKTQRKSKELNQVMPAWGKKTSTTESNFLEDFRFHRNTTSSVPLYEKEYETFGVDDTSMFIDGTANEDSTQSSVGDILNNFSHPMVQHRAEQSEESFDVSKIIDVEKFRAANVTENKEISNNHEDNETNGNEEDLTIKTESSQETCELTSSIQDKNTTEKEKSFTGLYNEDDNNLIDSIEREFLLTHDNFLPGQIIN